MLKVFSIVEKEWTGKRERERDHAQDETIGISISASSGGHYCKTFLLCLVADSLP